MQIDENSWVYDFTDIKKLHKDDNLTSEDMNDEEFPEILQKAANSIAKREGYVKHSVTKNIISTNGGNYLGVLYTVDIKGVSPKGTKETNIFVKRIIRNGNDTIFSLDEAYRRETFAYKELFKVYNELQDEAKIPKEERFKTIKSYEESNCEAIFMDNLAKKGYKTGHRMEVMSYKFAELSIMQLARFHGMSMVVQRKKPDYYVNTLKPLKQAFNYNEDWEKFIINMCELSRRDLDYASLKKTEQLASMMIEKLPKYAADDSSIGSCICHGDFRQNNILMKEDEGKMIEVIPIDYQFLYNGCPIADFLYFIFTGSDREFRRKHLDSLKELYYDSLDKFLKFFDMDVHDIYPKHEFYRQYREILDYGLMVFVYTGPFCFTSEDEVPDMGKDNLVNINFVLDGKFKDRVQGVIEDYIEWGYL